MIMQELATTQDIGIGENDWGRISQDPVTYESVIDNAIVEIVDQENKLHKITFRKGGVIELWKNESVLHIQWDEKDTV